MGRLLDILVYWSRELLGRALAFICLPFLLVVNILLRSFGHVNDIWLIGENQGVCLEDNGYAFYKYCRDTHPDKSIFFLIKADSPFYARDFTGDTRVIRYGSFRHMLCFSRAAMFLYTHTYRDVMYRRFFEVFGAGKKIVYLHHGTLGFKKLDAFYNAMVNILDVFIVGSDLERDILVDQVAVDPFRVMVTGYARNDFLRRDTGTPERQVIYMPTHRSYLKRESEKSEFVLRVNSLLNNTALLELLESEDVTLKVYPHQHAQKTLPFSQVSNPRVQFLRLGEQSVSDLMRSSMLMITDYSSVCWDFLALDKPVLFYRFDIEEYSSKRESYINLRKELIGEIAYTEEQLVQLLSHYLGNGCVVRHEFLQYTDSVRSQEAFPNCERIYRVSSGLLGGQAGL